MKDITICFTGHRNFAHDIEELRKRLMAIIEDLYNQGYSQFCAGGALGFDTLASQCVLRLKQEKKDVKLKIFVPHLNQSSGFSDEDKIIYEEILRDADEIILTSRNYYRGCYHTRNRAMVDESSFCVAYLNKGSGGTFYTYNYAKRKGLEIINLGTYKEKEEPQLNIFDTP